MIEKAIHNEEMLAIHRQSILEKLSWDLSVSPDIVSKLLNKGLEEGFIRYDDFYNLAKGYIFVSVKCK